MSKILIDEATVKLALEALQWCHGGEPCGTAEAITALQEALAKQPAQQQKPLVIYSPIETRSQMDGKHPNDNEPLDTDTFYYLNERGDDRGQGLCVYWKWGYAAGWNDHKRHIAKPAQRPWVGLTLERKMDMAESYFTDEWAINRAIQLLSGCENALKEENT